MYRLMHKIGTLEYTLEQRDRMRHLGTKFVLTNGCFDIVHAGHLQYLTTCSKKGYLSVAINSDKSVRALKGENRPIIEQAWRMMLVHGLKPVSNVFMFEGERLHNEIKQLRPDIYVKAGDYNMDTIDAQEREALLYVGADIQFVPTLYGLSTSSIIDKIKS